MFVAAVSDESGRRNRRTRSARPVNLEVAARVVLSEPAGGIRPLAPVAARPWPTAAESRAW
jgi:hypothetical protein